MPIKIKKLLLVTVLGLSVFMLGSGQAMAAKNPYFVVHGGDIFAGGWFNNVQNPCSNDPTQNYQAPIYNQTTSSYEPPASQYNGGILAYNKITSNNPTGAASDFGALALGLVEGNTIFGYGFASGPNTDNNSLTFANTASWGGLLAGANPTTHCIPDYYGTKQNSPEPWPGNIDNAENGKQYSKTASGDSYKLNGGTRTIHKSTSFMLFVQGNIYIQGDIVYESGYKANEVPHFALIVKGNIFIDPEVNRLDGLYIAQPDQSSQSAINSSGVIWTCHDQNLNIPNPSWLYNNCRNQLVFNGAVIAKQVALTRAQGDVSGSATTDIAEIFNYNPEMIIGGPFFNTSSTGSLQIDSIVSLPPIF